MNGPAFLLGWVLGLALVGAVLLAVTSGVASRTPGTPAPWGSGVVLGLGVLLLLVALQQWRGRPHEGKVVQPPLWMAALDTCSPVKAAGAGVVLSALNPKNFLLTVAGAAALAQRECSTGQQVVAYGVFILIATSGVGAPVMLYFVMGNRAHARLDLLRHWLARNSAVILAVLLLLIGLKLIGEGMAGLSR